MSDELTSKWHRNVHQLHSRPLCPLTSGLFGEETICSEGACAWFVAEFNVCAVVALSRLGLAVRFAPRKSDYDYVLATREEPTPRKGQVE